MKEGKVTVELITDIDVAMKETGLNFAENSLYYWINQEGQKDRTPVLVKDSEGNLSVIVKGVEKGNYMPDGCVYDVVTKQGIKVLFYAPYFTMVGAETGLDVPGDEGSALYKEYPVDTVTVYSDMPLARFRRFEKKFKLNVKPYCSEKAPVFAYAVDKAFVCEQFNTVPDSDKEIADKVMKEYTHMTAEERAIIRKYSDAPRKDQFEMLDVIMKENGIECILGDTNLTVHTFTAINWNTLTTGNQFAFYDGDKIVLLSLKEVRYPQLTYLRRYDDFEAAIADLAGGKKVGIETTSVPVGRVRQIGEDKTVDATMTLSLWRDRFAYQTLPYYVLNAVANRWAMEGALKYAEAIMYDGGKVTERDIERKQMELLDEFRKTNGFEHLNITKYFVVLHAGVRSPYPALASEYVLNKGMRTLKLDTGTLMLRDGVLLSGTDMARMILVDDNCKELYEILTDNIHKEVIPNIKDQMTGEEIYWLGVKPLAKLESHLKEIDAMAADFDLLNGFNRDIGHTIDKEESRTSSVEKGCNRKFENLMLGCIEYQWPYKDFCVGTEDMFFIAPEMTININY